MKKFIATALSALLLGACINAEAGMLADLSVINRSTGQPLPVYTHHGRYYVAGTPGDKYAVSVRNKTGQRVMAVVSVDGVNVVSGETAAPDQTGYVLWSSMQYEINGWRKSADEVAAFVFTTLPDSYAARTGRAGNVGVIGLALFQEFQPQPVLQSTPSSTGDAKRDLKSESRRDDAGKELDQSLMAGASAVSKQNQSDYRSADRAAKAESSARLRDEKLGTRHGEREVSQVSHTDFQRASERPAEVITIYYDSYRNLATRGIIPQPNRNVPNPFPAGGQYVPDPRG